MKNRNEDTRGRGQEKEVKEEVKEGVNKRAREEGRERRGEK